MIKRVKIPRCPKYIDKSIVCMAGWHEISISVDIRKFNDRYEGVILSKGIYPYDCAGVVDRFENSVLAFCHRIDMVVRSLTKQKEDIGERMKLFAKDNGYVCSDFMHEIESCEREISFHGQLKQVLLNVLLEDKWFLDAIRNLKKE